MANKKITKPVSKTLEMGDSIALNVRVFGTAKNRTPKSEIPGKIREMTLDDQMSLYAALGAYAAEINERMKAVESVLLANSSVSIQGAYGDPDANVAVQGSDGDILGNIVFNTDISDDLNTKGNTKLADEVKKALDAAKISSAYTKQVTQLNNAALKSDFLAGKLPNNVSSLLKVIHKQDRTVCFNPIEKKEEEQ